MQWRQRVFGPLDVSVGPCAWRYDIARSHPEYLAAHPSLLVTSPDATADELGLVRRGIDGETEPGRVINAMPIMLCIREPRFARRLNEQLEDRMAAVGRDRVDIVTMWVNDPADLKGGALLQQLGAWREAGRIGAIGLAHEDVRAVEWLAINAGVRVLMTIYNMADQAARYRTLPTADDYGIACVALQDGDGTARCDGADRDPIAPDAAAFALAEATRALPLFDAPLPDDIEPLSPEAVEACWDAYRRSHDEPQPLPRSVPPE